MVNLNRNNSNWSFEERRKINENWDILESMANSTASGNNGLKQEVGELKVSVSDINVRTRDNTQRINQVDQKFEGLREQVSSIIVENGNTDVEVVASRIDSVTGERFSSLPIRLDNQNSKISNDIIRLQIGKADKDSVQSQISNIVSGSPRGAYQTLVQLRSAFPSGSPGVYVVQENGHWYYYNETTNLWTDGGVYQSTSIGRNSVTYKEISPSGTSVNILDLSTLIRGSFYRGVLNSQPEIINSPNWNRHPNYIPVQEGDIVRFSHAFQQGYYIPVDANNIFMGYEANFSTPGYKEVVVKPGVVGFYTAVFNTYLDVSMITINNQLPESYESFGKIKKSLDWLSLSPRSVGYQELSEDVVSLINTGSYWRNKTFLTLGDSITYQDQKNYPGTQNLARGYQTHLREQLGFSNYINYGISGRPLANGTANGVGTNTTGKGIQYNTDLVIIAVGTNDFKLNVNLGQLGQIGDTIFDTNTFYGAYRDLIEYILTQKPEQQIILFTPLQRDNGGYDVNTVNTSGNKLSAYVQAVKEVGEMYSIPVCDMYGISGFTKNNLNIYTLDGLHPNDLGYERMGRVAVNFVRNN